MAYSSIPDSWREVGKAVKKDLIDLIHGNLEDLDGRITSVEGSISTTILVNEKVVKERDNQPLGTIVWSPLALADFQAEASDGTWALCNGGSCVGTDYATLMSRSVVPDLRGRFIRMKDHGIGRNPDGDVATDTAQAMQNLAHTHTIDHGHSHTIAASGTFASTAHVHNMKHVHQAGYAIANGVIYGMGDSARRDTVEFTHATTGVAAVTLAGNYTAGVVDAHIPVTSSQHWYTAGVINAFGNTGGADAVTNVPDATSSVSTSGTVTSMTGSSGSSGGATETRPINVTENAFIKTDRNYITARTGYFLWRAPQALTINQVIVSPVLQGTSGTLTIDVKKGDVTTQGTSIFTSLPDMAFGDTTAQTGTLDATNSEIEAGDYVRVDITTTQAKLKEFHILIAAAPA